VALGNLDLGIDTIRSAPPGDLDAAFRSALLEDLAHVSEGIEQAAEYLRSIQDRPFGAAGRMARFDVRPGDPVLRHTRTPARAQARSPVAVAGHRSTRCTSTVTPGRCIRC